MTKKAIIAMSGGVDSSVAAFLMRQAGYTCIGATMRLHGDEDASCGSARDVADARSVATSLGMEFRVFDFSDAFRREVVDRFVCAYEQGRTPNPCIDCNRHLKFDRLYRAAQDLGLDYVVTGHYARIERTASGRYLLKKGATAEKDQSYVLYALTQDQLAHTLFPLGGMRKEDVRALAAEQGFLNAKKRDSQDICFVPDGDYAAFIRRYTGKEYPPGDFVDVDGNVIGQHKGLICYTIGQRRGLGVAAGKPIYVKQLQPEENRVVLADNEQLYDSTVLAERFNWIAYDAPHQPVRVKARARYHHTEQPATATVLPDGRVEITFDTPQRALTCGQAVVLYDGDTVVGGGTICQVK